jgi:transposase
VVQKAREKKVSCPIKRESQTIFGALRFNGRLYWKKANRGNGDSFIWFMRQLLQNNPHKKIALILDNASQHACKKVRQFLERYPRIKLYFLPPYSPEYNPIERFWGWLKKHLYGSKSYERIQDVTKQMRQLIWHYQENKVTSKIHFNFDPYQKLINI